MEETDLEYVVLELFLPRIEGERCYISVTDPLPPDRDYRPTLISESFHKNYPYLWNIEIILCLVTSTQSITAGMRPVL